MNDVKQIINNEYDYSNVVATADSISYLVKFCDEMYKQLQKLIKLDEEKNKPLKDEYKNYSYKKSYKQEFEVYIREKKYNTITCKDYDSFVSAINDGSVNNLSGLDIKLNLSYSRGTGNNLVEHEHFFTITFKPYEITFKRTSNFNDDAMNQVENQINTILKQFPVANSIFCTK